MYVYVLSSRCHGDEIFPIAMQMIYEFVCLVIAQIYFAHCALRAVFVANGALFSKKTVLTTFFNSFSPPTDAAKMCILHKQMDYR